MSLAFSHYMPLRMSSSTHRTKNWLRAVAAHLNVSPSALALASGVAASTLTRYLNDESNTVGISQSTLEKIEEYSGISVFQMPGQRARGLSEPDAEPYDLNGHNDGWLQTAITAACHGNNNVFPFRMRSWALDQCGVIPGDILIIDMSGKPRQGDIVCAQVTDWQTGSAETIMRIYEAPYLLAQSAKLGIQRPIVVDEERVAIRGVMMGSMRARS